MLSFALNLALTTTKVSINVATAPVRFGWFMTKTSLAIATAPARIVLAGRSAQDSSPTVEQLASRSANVVVQAPKVAKGQRIIYSYDQDSIWAAPTTTGRTRIDVKMPSALSTSLKATSFRSKSLKTPKGARPSPTLPSPPQNAADDETAKVTDTPTKVTNDNFYTSIWAEPADRAAAFKLSPSADTFVAPQVAQAVIAPPPSTPILAKKPVSINDNAYSSIWATSEQRASYFAANPIDNGTPESPIASSTPASTPSPAPAKKSIAIKDNAYTSIWASPEQRASYAASNASVTAHSAKITAPPSTSTPFSAKKRVEMNDNAYSSRLASSEQQTSNIASLPNVASVSKVFETAPITTTWKPFKVDAIASSTWSYRTPTTNSVKKIRRSAPLDFSIENSVTSGEINELVCHEFFASRHSVILDNFFESRFAGEGEKEKHKNLIRLAGGDVRAYYA